MSLSSDIESASAHREERSARRTGVTALGLVPGADTWQRPTLSGAAA